MAAEYAHARELAMQLPPELRDKLANELQESLEDNSERIGDFESKWLQLAAHRYEATRSGEVKTVSEDKARAINPTSHPG